MKRIVALLLAGLATAAFAEPCLRAGDVQQADMLGLWRAELDGVGHVGTLLLQKHAEYPESFSGWIDRNGERRELAGDVEDGEFTLEESADGVHIAANWVGELVEGSCGREARGVWTIDGAKSGKPFVLRKD
jgi:hypothetical protein